MSKHTPGPLFVSVENKWPFKIVTKNEAGEVVFNRDMPRYSTKHKNAADALAGYGLNPKWNAAEMNAKALADEVLRAAAPDMLEALQDLFGADMEHVLMGDGKEDQIAAIAKARSAIAKATKETP